MQTDDRIASSSYGSGMSTPVFLDRSIRRRWRRRRPYSFSLTPAIVLSLVLTASAFQGPAWTPRNSQWSTPSYGYTPHHGGEPHSIRLQSSATETLESEPSSSASSGSRSFTDANNVHVVDSKSKLQDPIEATVVNCSLSSIPAMNGVAETNITSESELDVPRPTDKGGYSHTVASKAKISAANKGKTPWNKGKKRSEEVRARIAAGVRAKNRERFLQNLKDMGLTEEEFNLKKKADRRRKDAERRTRRTEKGGYKPTEETKKKISQILKQKWANGEISKRTVNPAKVRRGFTHSPETRAKISESLKKRWSQDVDYRDNMLKKSHSSNSDPSVKQKISEALKKKWKNPEFRANMLEKMAKNRGPAGPHEKSHREKISAAMKAKWQDDDYRRKTLASIQKHRAEALASRPALPKTKKAKPTKPKTTPSKAKRKADDVVRIATPLTGKVETKRRVTKKRVRKKSDSIDLEGASLVKAVPSQKKRKSTAPKREADGSINRLREERRDLYELLYGDESNEATSELGDENLDSFDPYGLEDF